MRPAILYLSFQVVSACLYLKNVNSLAEKSCYDWPTSYKLQSDIWLEHLGKY